MTSNYDAVLDSWRRRFLEMDCAQLASRFHLQLDEENLYITYFACRYAVSRADGSVFRIDRPGDSVGFNTAITFYNMFHYAVPDPRPSGRLVPFRSVRRVYPFEDAYRRQILRPFSEAFTGRVPALRRALSALCADPIPQGDAGGLLEIFPGLKLSVSFWDADDEFPAQTTFLFDYNITDYMHEENVVCVAADAARFLEEAGE